MNLPNAISLSRLLLIPLFIWTIILDNNNSALLALGVLCLSGITDMLDGFLARKLNQVTELGKIIDPLADKLIIISAAFALTVEHRLNIWLTIIIACRELCMVIGTAVNLKKHQAAVSASYLGKATTCMFYVAVIFFLFNWPFRYGVMTAAIILSLMASFDYFQKAFSRPVQL